ncbi:MAG: tetratricopeptide repeat protein [Bacteroidia bacterium]|nr:tetratricopeptide repeat protein [Bacteroidia bacterium]
MSQFEKELELKSEEELEALALQFKDKINLETEEILSSEQIREMFHYHSTLLALGEIRSAADLHAAIRPHIDRLIASGNEPEASRDLLTDWVFVLVNTVEEARDSFVSLPHYQEIFAAFDELGDGIYPKKLKTGLQMGHHYKYWITIGGLPENLSDEDREFLEDAADNWVDGVENAIESLEESEEWDKVADLKKAMYRFYLHGKRPNEAIATLKELIEVTPQTSTYHPADVGDLYLDLGKLFTQHSKWAAAIKYFEKAREIYEELGDDFELFTMQAEGWIAEAEKMMG